MENIDIFSGELFSLFLIIAFSFFLSWFSNFIEEKREDSYTKDGDTIPLLRDCIVLSKHP